MMNHITWTFRKSSTLHRRASTWNSSRGSVTGWSLFAWAVLLCTFSVFCSIPVRAQQVRILKLSHQYPASHDGKGDYRDVMAHKFAKLVEQKTGGKLKIQIYPGASLMNPKQQIDAMINGTLDFSIVPLGYAGGKIPVANIGLLPAIIDGYKQGLAWENAPIGKALKNFLEKHGLRSVIWVWQGGGCVSNKRALLVPADVKGLKVRGAGRGMSELLQAAGGGLATFPSNESYNAMQSGIVDGLCTSSASLLGFHLYEVGKYVTTARDKTWGFYFQPLWVSEKTYQSLTPKEQKVITEAGHSLEQWALDANKAADERVAKVFAKAGDKVEDMNEAQFKQWRALAKRSAWKDFAARCKECKELLKMAVAVK